MCQKTHHSFAMDAVDEAALTVVPHAPAGRTLHVSFLPMGLAANDGVQTEMMHINSTTPLDVWTQRVREFIRFPATRPLRYRVGVEQADVGDAGQGDDCHQRCVCQRRARPAGVGARAGQPVVVCGRRRAAGWAGSGLGWERGGASAPSTTTYCQVRTP